MQISLGIAQPFFSCEFLSYINSYEGKEQALVKAIMNFESPPFVGGGGKQQCSMNV